jgi:hypothetical protein
LKLNRLDFSTFGRTDAGAGESDGVVMMDSCIEEEVGQLIAQLFGENELIAATYSIKCSSSLARDGTGVKPVKCVSMHTVSVCEEVPG